MRAAVVDAPGAMRVGSWPTPEAGAAQMVVGVAAVGICASDLYIYQGKNPYAVYPQVIGHEIAGRVAHVGEGVTGFQPGQPVVIEPFIGCGDCYPCRVGKSNCCVNLSIIGIHRPGGFGDFVVAPAANVHPIPEGLDLETAAFAEPVAIAIQISRRGKIEPGDTVLVLGCGPIGLAVIEVARERGAAVLATDTLEDRRRAAAGLGAAVLPAGTALLPALLEQTRGEGAPVVVEATGSARAMEQACELVCAGGRVVIAGVVKQGTTLTLPALDFTRREMTIVGSRASVRCFPEALDLLARGAIRYPEMATRFSLWDAPRVFEEMTTRPRSIQKALLLASS